MEGEDVVFFSVDRDWTGSVMEMEKMAADSFALGFLLGGKKTGKNVVKW